MLNENIDTTSQENEEISQANENQDQKQTDNASVETPTDESGEENTNVGKLTPEQQEWMNAKITERLARQKSSFLKKYGVEKEEELDNLFEKAKSYDAMSERFEKTEAENKSLSEQLTFINNNIDPERYDDVRVHFKGSNLEFNNESLVEQLKTHPEWVKKEEHLTTTLQTLSPERVPTPSEDASAKRRRVFGY